MYKTFDAMELNEMKINLACKVDIRSQSPIGWSFLRKDFSFIFTDSFDRDLYLQMLGDSNYRYNISKEKRFLFHNLTYFNTDDRKWKIYRNRIICKIFIEFDVNNIQVTFYTYYGHAKKTILKHTDVFSKGSYRFESSCEKIAEGGEGYLI